MPPLSRPISRALTRLIPAIDRRPVTILGAALALAVALALSASSAAVAVEGDARRLTLLLVGSSPDIEAGNGNGEKAAALARVATVAKQERAHAPTLLLHGGDTLSTGLLSAFDQGAHLIDLLNGIEADAMAVQPRELNNGKDALSIRAGEASFPFVTTNLLSAEGDGPPEGLESGVMLQTGGVRIGVVSALPPRTSEISNARPLRIVEPIAAVRAAAGRLRREGAALVVLLTRHMGDPALDTALARDGGADIVLRLDRAAAPPTVSRAGAVVTVTLGGNDAPMAAVDLVLPLATEAADEGEEAAGPAWTASVRLIDRQAAPPDPEIMARVETYLARLAGLMDLPVVRVATAMDMTEVAVRMGENAFANLLADAARSATGADVAIVNGGQIRGNRTFQPGHILTRGDLLRALPFRNRLVTMTVTGAQLRAALEHGFSDPPAMLGRFPHLSGARVALDPTAPPGHRVATLTVAGRPVVDDARYTLAVPDFLAAGGDGYAMLRGPVPPEELPGDIVSTVITRVLRDRGTVAPVVEGRIRLGPAAGELDDR
ncbi:MAG: hypothetical protein RLY86_333 [Pseudomonadota bacterium]|jgi:2',3'-cyclic-nucleotide 2'-phosphodiesterase (5'-nucleotidase family)